MKQADLTKILIILIAVLAVILVAVICIALDSGTPQNTEPGTTTTAPSGTTGGTEEPPTSGTTAYVGLDAIFKWGYADTVAKVSAIVCTLIGSLIGISTAEYNRAKKEE
jgi:hypothetical protein